MESGLIRAGSGTGLRSGQAVEVRLMQTSGASRDMRAKLGFKLNLGNITKVNRLAIFEVVIKTVFIGFWRVL